MEAKLLHHQCTDNVAASLHTFTYTFPCARALIKWPSGSVTETNRRSTANAVTDSKRTTDSVGGSVVFAALGDKDENHPKCLPNCLTSRRHHYHHCRLCMTRPMSAPLILNNSEANSVACEEYEISAPCPLSQLVFNERQFANRSQSDEAIGL